MRLLSQSSAQSLPLPVKSTNELSNEEGKGGGGEDRCKKYVYV